jgi:Protein of unknown function (DUF1236)
MEEKIMRAHYLLSAATACLLLTSGLSYAQTPAETRKDEPRKERVEKDQPPTKGSETRSEAKPQERTRERGEAGAPRQAGEEHAKPLNAAERNGPANPEEQKGARRGGEAAKPNEHADESRHEGAAKSAHDNRDERTKSSATPNAEKSAAEKSAPDKSVEDTRQQKSGAASDENSQTRRGEAAKGSQQSPSPDTKGAANETDKAKSSNEAQRGANNNNGAQPNNEAQRGATNAAQPNSATAASSQLPRDKEVRISETLKQHELAPPERNLNISITVGTEIPERVRVHRLPPEIVSIAPEYRDYDYFSTDDDIVIVEPRTHRIVSQVPRDVSRSRAETQSGATSSSMAANVGGGAAGPCQIQKRDASGQLTEVAPTTVGSAAQSRNSIAIIVQTQDQRSSSPIALDAAAGQIIVASQGPGDCRVTIEPEPAR